MFELRTTGNGSNVCLARQESIVGLQAIQTVLASVQQTVIIDQTTGAVVGHPLPVTARN